MANENHAVEPSDDELRYEVINELIAAGVVQVTAINAHDFSIEFTEQGRELCGKIDE